MLPPEFATCMRQTANKETKAGKPMTVTDKNFLRAEEDYLMADDLHYSARRTANRDGSLLRLYCKGNTTLSKHPTLKFADTNKTTNR